MGFFPSDSPPYPTVLSYKLQFNQNALSDIRVDTLDIRVKEDKLHCIFLKFWHNLYGSFR